MEQIIKTASERLSFLGLIEKDYKIVIPLIQRDYAQGRASKEATKIRQDFVEELHSKILGHIPMSLDFVYGTRGDSKFIPIDGQQRLTTLFLLHIYLEGLTLSYDSHKEKSRINYAFSYETRDSSRRFCDSIIEHRFEVFDQKKLNQTVEEKDGKKKQTPSMIIKNQSWWFGVWESDPTVSGMLNMLDEIHKRFFSNAVEAYDILFAPDSQILTFQFMPLEKFYDPDDLYMKMNARGLPLTPFEIFKSRFYGDIESQLSLDEVKSAKSNIDVNYTDFLWPLRKPAMKNIDIYFQRIFKLIIAAEHVALSKESDKKWLDYLFEANYKTYPFAHNQFLKMNVAFTKPLINRLLNDLYLLCSKDSLFHKQRHGDNSLSEWIDASKLWDDLIIDKDNGESRPTYRQRLELHALLRFFSAFPLVDMPTQIPVWTRLIHNLIEASNLDSSERMASALRNIDTLVESLKGYNEATDVNDWISSSKDLKNNFFSDSQWQEEVVKANLRKDNAWNKEILRAERHPYLNGEIAVILWLSGIVPSHTPFSFDADKANLQLFTDYIDKLLPLMDEIGNVDSGSIKKHKMVRAMLNKGDYMPWTPRNRRTKRNTYNRPGHRDYSWKVLFRINDDSNYTALDCLKQIVDDKDFHKQNVENSLETIGSRKLPNSCPIWRRLLTSRFGHKIFTHSNQGFIAFDEENVLIYGSTQRNGFHSELCTLYLFLLLKEKGLNVQYNWVLGKDSDYSLTFKNVSGEDVTISYWNGEWYTQDKTFKDPHSLRKFIEGQI